jgi:crotonobetainyl-CoA:carnitine CoA-transferase CaiB-like acyl-CoA transferase
VKRPGQDLILQGYSGSMWNGGKEGDAPIASPLYVADATAAHIVVEGVLGALLWRERGGSGQLVEVNMLDAMVDLQVQELSVFLTGGVRPKRTKESFAHVLLTAPYGVYRTKDGYMTVSIGPIPVLGEVLDNDRLRGMKEWGDGMTYRDEIYRIVAAALPARSTAEWMERFQQHDFWVGPVYDYDDLVADPQVKHNGSFIEIDHPTEGKLKLPGIPIHYSESPGSIRYHHPAVGEQSVDVLREIGFAEKEIEALGAGGVVQLAASPGRP